MGKFREIVESYKEAKKDLIRNEPETMKNYQKFVDSVLKDAQLSTKTKELIALGIAIAKRCDYCIGIHVEKALKAGATKEEIIEASLVAVLMEGGPAMTYFTEVKKALEEFC
ncbi:MAG: carboxymuconolactone decarboxylase family protein [Thermoplasmatales archaeon]|nr:carboxymuconolactone decarboxylase family protein [Thermoplasmatales archaeon]